MDDSNAGTGVSDDLDEILLDDEDASSEYCDLPPPRKKNLVAIVMNYLIIWCPLHKRGTKRKPRRPCVCLRMAKVSTILSFVSYFVMHGVRFRSRCQN